MKTLKKSNELAHALRDFFTDHLACLRGTSPHTILSYRDCFILLLRYVATLMKCPVTELDVEDLDAKKVILFLQMLENERGNSITTRNARLSAIHTFFSYIATKHPERIKHCQQILSVPFKRTLSRQAEYLEYEEIQAILAVIDQSKKDGRRDYVLLVTMFNTGARIQEILDMRVHDLQLTKPYQVHLLGKGRKERICPLWAQTALLLRKFLKERCAPQSEDHVFLNHRKEPLTRFGVRYILIKYCELAKTNVPSLIDKKLHPHIMRHSTAVHLLQSGVDIVTISHWLGHANINTTNKYISIDLEMKRKAINKAAPTRSNSKKAPWLTNTSILEWLEAL